MKSKNLKSLVFAALFLIGLATLASSCNRGVGCPNNFSIEQPQDQVNPQ